MRSPDVKAPHSAATGEAQDGITGQGTAESLAPADDAVRKRFARLQALAALAGFRLQRIGDSYMVSRWLYCTALDEIDAVEGWLRRAGVRT